MLQNRLTGNIRKIYILKDNVMCICLKRLHAAGFFRLVHDAEDLIFRDHQILIAGEIYKDRIRQLRTE